MSLYVCGEGGKCLLAVYDRRSIPSLVRSLRVWSSLKAGYIPIPQGRIYCSLFSQSDVDISNLLS